MTTASYIPISETPGRLAGQIERSITHALPQHNKHSQHHPSIIESIAHSSQHSQHTNHHQEEPIDEYSAAPQTPSVPQSNADERNQELRKRSICGSCAGDVPVKMGCFPLTGSIIRSVIYGIPKVVKAIKICLIDHAGDPGLGAGNGFGAGNGAAIGMGLMG